MFGLHQSEDRMILSSFVWVQYQNTTDRWTDGIAVAIMCLALCAVARVILRDKFSKQIILQLT